jgi:hypothetical protein
VGVLAVLAGDVDRGASAQTISTPTRYGQLPLSFEANQGQADPRVDFVSRGWRSTLFLTPTEALVAPDGGAADSGTAQEPARNQSAGLRMKLVGANLQAGAEGLEPLSARSHYFIGGDSTKWLTDVPHYRKARYRDIYPGIDLVYYGTSERQLEYDFIVAPGADPSLIALQFEGAKQLEVDVRGDLRLRLRDGEVRFRKPRAYQEAGGERREVASRYSLGAENQVAFQLDDYDPRWPLVIDPVLVYSTFLGGSIQDFGGRIAVDADGNAYVMGGTNSFDFPIVNAVQGNFSGNSGGGLGDVFITKINAAGTALVYSTYLGGSNGEEVRGDIAVDAGGNVYVTGRTASNDFPTTPGAFDTACGNLNDCSFSLFRRDAFVAKLSSGGDSLAYSTFLGGGGSDEGRGIAVDTAGNAYVTGQGDLEFPTTPGAFQETGSGCFVTKLNAAGTALVYSTLFNEAICNDMAVDTNGNVYLTGETNSPSFPATAGAFDTGCGTDGNCNLGSDPGNRDAFVTKLDPAGAALVYSTFLGGSGPETGEGITVDAAGNAYVTGQTSSNDFPTASAFQAVFGGSTLGDAFVTKLNPTGSGLAYSTYLGGADRDAGADIAVDASGNAHVTGLTVSSNFPIVDPIQATFAGGSTGVGGDTFVARIDPTAVLAFSTYLGGSGTDEGNGIAVDAAGNAYVVGETSSAGFPTANPVQSNFGGNFDAFVAKMSGAENPTPTIISLVPDQTAAGGAGFTLGVNGSGFVPASVVRWNGSDRPTTFESSSELSASISAGDLAGGGEIEVTVFNPAPGGGESTPATFAVTDFSLSASPSSQTVQQTMNTEYTVTVTAEFGAFNSTVTLSCVNLPRNTSCQFEPATLSPGVSEATSQLTISTLNVNASLARPDARSEPSELLAAAVWRAWSLAGLFGLGAMGLLLFAADGPKRKRPLLAAALLLTMLLLQMACGGNPLFEEAREAIDSISTPRGTHTITIRGTSGSLTHSTNVTLVVQ